MAFRRWKRPTVRAGGTLRTPAGVLCIDTVEVIDEAGVTEADARLAGHPDRDAALAALRSGPDRTLYRIAFRHCGDDPRAALRDEGNLSSAQLAAVGDRLDRLDARSAGPPWTRAVLGLIAERPGVVARLLAAQVGSDVPRFKRRVRALKELGLTESLPVGYRLSPRGVAVLAAGSGRGQVPDPDHYGATMARQTEEGG